MSESKKLNRLNLNKETITDLEVPQAQDVVGGFKSQNPNPQCMPTNVTKSPTACIPQSAAQDARCGSGNPLLCIANTK